MFVTTREPGPRRRNKIYGNAKAARSSRFSLLSAFTAATEGSGGSSSTITQESYLRSVNRAPTGRRRKARHRHHRSSTASAIHERSVKVDVFDFLVEDKKLKDEREAEKSEVEEDAIDEEDIHQDKPEDFYRYASDSGVADSTYGSLSGSVQGQRPPSLPEEPHSRPLSSHSYLGQPRDLVPFDPRWHWNSSSPVAPTIPYPIEGYIPPPCPPPPPAVPCYDFPPHYPDIHPGVQTPPSYRGTDYGLTFDVREPVAVENNPRCFRSFTKLSTQLLLQMQNDITELESELEAYDAEAERNPPNASYGSNDRLSLPQRAEICQELHFKLDQYYQALAAQNKVKTSSRPVSSSELDTYRHWLETRIVPKSRVTPLIKDDIRAFDQSQKSSDAAIKINFPALAFGALVYAFLPLLSFRLLSNILSRLSTLIVFAITGFVAQDRISTTIRQIEMACFMAFLFVSTMAAIVL